MRKEEFAERSSALILISLVVLGLVQSWFNSRSGTDAKPDNVMIFPAYRVEENMDMINSAMPFAVKVDFPDGWTITTEKGEHSWVSGEFFTPYYIYNGDKPVAIAGFNVYEGDIKEIDYENSYKTALDSLSLSSEAKWDDFKPVLNGFTNQIGVMTVTFADGSITPAVVAYDINLNSYFALAFMPEVMDEAGAIEIAKTVRIRAQ